MVERFQPKYELYVLLFPNQKRYFGISKNAKKRYYDHLCSKNNYPVHYAIRKYGPPILRIICVGRRTYIQQLEIACIAKFETTDRGYGYNVSLGGELGPTPEMAAKISKTKLAQKYSPPIKVREQISLKLLEYFKTRPDPIPPKHRAAINRALAKGRKKPPPFSKQHRENLRNAMLLRGAAQTEHLQQPEVIAKAKATKRAKCEALAAAGLPLISETTRAKHKAYRPTAQVKVKTSVTLRAFNKANPGYFVGRSNTGKFTSNDPKASVRKQKLIETLRLKKKFFEETQLMFTQGLGFSCADHKQLFQDWRKNQLAPELREAA
jgi:hypothetical protein